MFDYGTKVRIIKPLRERMVMPIVGTEAEVVPCPNPPSKWDPPGSENWVWVRVDKRVPHGIDCDETPYGIHDMSGSVWLVDEDDFDDPDRAFTIIALDADCVELASSPSSIAGKEQALVAAWKLECERAKVAYEAEHENLISQRETLFSEMEPKGGDLDDDFWSRYKALDALMDEHREGKVGRHINWNNCLKAVGL